MQPSADADIHLLRVAVRRRSQVAATRLPSTRPLAVALCAFVAVLCCGLVAVAAPADAAVTRAQAQKKALSALGARRGSAPLIVFRDARPLKPGTLITVAGLERLPRQTGRSAAHAARSRDELLRAAGVSVVKAPRVARVGREPVWFFYADERPFAAYQHPGRVALVGQRSGRVTVSRRFSWPPLLDGRLPYFLRSYAGYRNPRARAFTRLWRPERPKAKAGPARAVSTLRASNGTPAERRAAAALAAEHSCVVRVGDTLGNFFDAASFDRTRARFGDFFNALARYDGGFVSARYRVATGTTLQRYVERLMTGRGCADVFLYVAGGGYVNGGEPAITVGVQGRRDGRVEQQVVTATMLRTIVAANPSVTFKLLLDAPGSGGFLKPLAGLPNLLIALTSSQAGQGSFTALPDLVAADGSKLLNRYNRGGLLEFSNRGLTGLRCFVADAAEVDGAIAAKERGLTRSFLAWMLRRAYALCGEGSLAEVVDGAPSPVLETHGFTAVPPDELPPGGPPTPPGPKNAAPTAAPVAVTTEEDTPVPVALAGADPDGDALAYAVGTPSPSGTVTGAGAARTFTPAPDFNGIATFDYTVADGRGGSATATVTVTVTPVDDPPVLDAGAGTTAWAEGDPPAAVAPQLTVRDVDDDQLDGATVTIAGGYEAGADRLSLNGAGAGGIAAAWDAASGTLRLSGAATVAAYEAALREVAFDNSSQTPSEAPRTVTFRVTGHGVSSAPSSRALTVEDRNAPPQLGGADTTRTFTEGDAAPVALFPSLTVADADDATLTGATVTLGAGFSAGEDELTFADQRGISGSWDAATGVLRLTGAASLADYETALRTVGYRNTRADDPTPGDRAVALRVSDGKDASAPEQTTVTVVAVNDPPVLGGGGSTAAFTEDGPAVVAFPNLTVSDVDDARLASATVTVDGGFSAGEDELVFTDQNGIAGSWNGAAGVLTLTGGASLADYQTALRSVRYRDTSDDPSTVTRGLTVQVSDGDASSNTVTASVTVTAVNDLPTVTAGGGSPTYSEGDATGVVVDPAITVTDPDDAQLALATVTIAPGFDGGGDVLTFTNTSTVVGSWNGLTGVLTLAGPATPAEFQAALRTVRFRSTSADPAPGPRTISFAVSDGTGASAPATTTVAFDLVDDAPTVTTSAGQTVWAGADVAVDPALTIADPDSARLTGATVTVSGGYSAAEDELTYTDQAGISGVWDALTGTLTLTGDAPLADWRAALRTVAYRHVGPLLDTSTRTIAFVVENTRRSSGAVKQLVFGNPPAIDLPSGGLAYTENDPATAVDGALTVSDPDGDDLTGAIVALTSGYAPGEDLLSATTSGTAITASYSAGTLTLSGRDTPARYQQVLRTVAYRNTSDDPSTATRTAEFTVTDGVLSAADSTTVTVTAVDDAPVVTTSSGTADYTEDDTVGVAVDPAVTVTDVDDTQLTGATVRVTANFAAGEDVLTFTAGGGIGGSYSAADGTLTLTGTATLAAYEAALRSVRYVNSDTVDPSTAVRTVSFTATDGTTESAAATRGVTVRAVDDAPVVTSTDTLDYTENDAPTAIVPTLTVSDGDSPQLVGAVVSVSGSFRAAEDVVTFVNQNGITGSYNAATGRLTLTGSATVAQYQAALRSVRYSNSSEDPSEAERSVTITVDDGELDSDAVVRPITVRKVNDAPVVPQTTVGAVGNTPLAYGTAAPTGRPAKVVSGSVLTGATDVDGPGPLRVDVAASPTIGDRGGSVAWNADGTFTYRPAANVGDTETLTFSVTDQGSPAATTRATVAVSVGTRVVYVDNSAAPGGDGRSDSPFDTLAQAAAVADRAGDRIYLFNGDGTTTGMSGGVALRANQQLLGERQPLTVDGSALAPARTSVRPQLVGPVTLRSGNTVAGLTVVGDAAGAAAAIQGSATAADGTLRDLVLDGRAGGGLSLFETTGSWTVTEVAVRASGGGTALSVTRAGTVAFGGANSVTAQAGTGVAVTGTTTSGAIGSVTVNSSGSHTGIALSGNSGSLTIPSVSIATAGPGITVADSEGVSIGSVDGSSVTAGGAAVTTSQTRTLTAPPTIALATASSTGGAYGIQLGAGGTGSGGSFRALGGSLSGHTTAELAVDGGPTTVEYGGTIGDGTGLSARIANRRAGTVSVTGSIADGADAGGGIQLTGNSGGSTSFSGSPVTLNSGASPALSLAYTGSHAVTFSGRLDLDTTSGAGVSATGSSTGTLALTGAGSTLTSSAGGTALTVTGPQIAAGGLTFRSIDQTGGTNAIVLTNPGSAGGLAVTGDPAGSPTAGSGGTLSGQTGDAVKLINASNVRFAAVAIRNASGSGIAADGLTGFALTDASAVTGNGAGNGGSGSGLSLRGLGGTVAIRGANVSDNAFRNLDVVASGSTLDADVVGGTYSGTARSASGDDSVHVEAESGTVSVDLTGLTMSGNRGDHVQFTSSSGSTATATVGLTSSTLSNAVGTPGGGVVVNPGGDSANWEVNLAGNTITGARNEAITVDTPGSGIGQAVRLRTLLTSNTIGSSGIAGSGSGTGAAIGIRSNGGASVIALVNGNVVRRYATAGMTLVQNDGSGRLDVTAWNNRFNEPDGAGLPVDGVNAMAGGAGPADNGRLCLDLGRSGANDVGSAPAAGGYGITVRQRDQATVAIPGFTGTSTDYAAVTTLLQQRNTVGAAPTALVTGTAGSPGFVNGSPNCAQ